MYWLIDVCGLKQQQISEFSTDDQPREADVYVVKTLWLANVGDGRTCSEYLVRSSIMQLASSVALHYSPTACM